MAIDLLAAVISCIIGYIIGVMNPFKNLGKPRPVQNTQVQQPTNVQQTSFYNPQMQPPKQEKIKLSKPIGELPDHVGEPQ